MRVRAKRIRRAVALVAAVIVTATLLAAAPAQATAVCVTSSPGSYSVTACLDDPGTLQGDTIVSGTVTTSPDAPAVARVTFRLGSSSLLADFDAPYTFILPSARWTDGQRTLHMVVRMADGWEASPASRTVTFANGIKKVAPNTRTFTPRTGTPPALGAPLVVAATGDGAGGNPAALDVVDLIASWNPNMFLYLGDVYNSGTPTEFYNWYGHNGSWFHRFYGITNPTPGNHEYGQSNASGYVDYWDNVPKYYSVDAGGWHIVSLDSNPRFGQLDPTSAQYQWLADDLARNAGRCTVVFAHHARFSLTTDKGLSDLQPIWELLATHGVELYVVGHAHHYERWVPLDGAGQPSPGGVTQFVVGTGGLNLSRLSGSDPRVGSAFADAFGALRLELGVDGANYSFVSTTGQVRDAGRVDCVHARDTTAPTVPSAVEAYAQSGAVTVSWAASSDDAGVTGYRVQRDGTIVADVPGTSWVDSSLEPGQTASYQVAAYDAAGNTSSWSTAASVTAPAGLVVFADGFETGNLSSWTASAGLAVQGSTVASGSWAAVAATDGSTATFASRALAAPAGRLTYRLKARIEDQGSRSAYLLRFKTASGATIAGVYRSSKGKLALRNAVAGKDTSSSATLGIDRWYDLAVTLDVATGAVTIRLDGETVLDRADFFGTAAIAIIEVGDSTKGAAHRFFYDDVAVVDPAAAPDTTPPSVPQQVTATVADGTVQLRWSPSTDDVGVAGYRVERDGTLVAEVTGTSWDDPGVPPGQSSSYRVAAVDGAGNTSPWSTPVAVTVPGPPPEPEVVFGDGFETGDLSAWTTATGLVVQGGTVAAGSWAALVDTDGSTAAFASRTLTEPLGTLTYRLQVRVEGQGSSSVYLLRFKTASGATIAGLYRSSNGKLGYRNTITGRNTASKTTLEPNRWYDIAVRLDVATGQIMVSVDGVVDDALTRSDDFGATSVGRVEVGDSTKGAPHRAVYDQVRITR